MSTKQMSYLNGHFQNYCRNYSYTNAIRSAFVETYLITINVAASAKPQPKSILEISNYVQRNLGFYNVHSIFPVEFLGYDIWWYD